VILGLTFGGCGKKKQEIVGEGEYSGEVYPENGLPKNNKVTISAIIAEQGTGIESFKYAVETFEKKFPNVKVDVHWIEAGLETAYKIIDSAIQSGSDKDMYDWIHTMIPDSYQSLSQAGKLEIQTDLWERNLYDSPNKKVKEVIMGDMKEIFMADGNMYGLPRGLVIYGLYYNKKLFQENGWNDNPSHWEEFMETCAKIKSAGMYPMVMAGKFPFYFDFAWNAIPYEIGGLEYRDFVHSNRPDIYISKPYLTQLERMEEFAQKGYFHPGTVSFDHTQSQMEFLQGEAALIPNGTWIGNEMKEVTPKEFKWGFMPMPGNNPGGRQVVLTSQGCIGFIWKNKPALTKQWAKEFNLWLLNLDIMLRDAKSGSIPVRNDFELDPKVLSSSVVVAMNSLRSPDVITINPHIKEHQINNIEMSKVGKVKLDGYISLVTGKKSVIQVANEINLQYMKGLNY
jgi:N-acetylglucosamine transport system substrate-binding protein